MSVAVVTRHLFRSVSCLSAALGLTLAPAGKGYAATLCAEVESIVGQAASNFANWTSDVSGAGALPKLSGAEACAVAQSLSGSKTYACRWEFPYRAETAYSGFDALNSSLKGCFGGAASVSRDQRVNHPDFYDLQLYRLGRAEVAVSIKDKSALQRTYLFLRVRGAEPD